MSPMPILPFDASILAGTKSAGAIAQYTYYFGQYLAYAGSFECAVSPQTLLHWREYLVNTTYSTKAGPHHYSVNAINVRLSAVRSIMHEASNQHLLPRVLADEFASVAGIRPKTMDNRRNPYARVLLTPAQMRAICDTPDVNTLAGVMHRAFLSTLAGSGLRVSEAVHLTLAQLDGGTDPEQPAGFAVLMSSKKNGAQEPRPLSQEAYQRIQHWLSVRPVASDYIFTGFSGRGDRGPLATPIRPVSAWEMVRRYAQQVGIKHVKPHDFRRFVAAQLAVQDVRLVPKALGHKRLDNNQSGDGEELARGITDHLY